MSGVPRATDFTGKQSAEERAAEREWQAARQRYRDDRIRHGYGTPTAKEAWKERVRKTRSH